MKHLISLSIAVLVTFTAFGQSTPTNKVRSNDSFTQVDNYLVAAKRLGIPTGSSLTLDAPTSSENTAKLFWLTSDSTLHVWVPGINTWLPAGGGTGGVTSVNGKVGAVVINKSDVGLGNVDNTSDANKPVSSATQSALNAKENAFSKNSAFNKNFGTTSGTVAQGNDSRINNGQTAFSWGNHASAGYAVLGTSGSQVRTNTQLDARYLQSGDLPAAQTLSRGSDAGQIILSGGGGNVTLQTLSRQTWTDFDEGYDSAPVGIIPVFSTTGATGFPSATSQGIVSKRGAGSASGSFAIFKSSGSSETLRYKVGTGTDTWTGWETFASRSWADGRFVNTTSNQGSILGQKFWTGNWHQWTPGSNPPLVPSTVTIGQSGNSPFLRITSTTNGLSIFRGYATDGVQLVLNEGGVETPRGASINSGGNFFAGGFPILSTNNGGTSISPPVSGGGIIYISPLFGSSTGRATFSTTSIVMDLLSGPGTQMVTVNSSGGLGRGNPVSEIRYGADYSSSFVDRSLVDKAYVDGQSVIEALDEGNGVGYRIRGRNPNSFGDIGLQAVDFSYTAFTSGNYGATGAYSFAVGNDVIASGTASAAFGFGSEATAHYSVAFGRSEASGNYALASGQDNVVSGIASASFGSNNNVSGAQSVAMGASNAVTHNQSMALGSGLISGNGFQSLFGRFNIQTSDALLVAGNGLSVSSRSNAYVLYNDGRSEQEKDVEVTEIGQGFVLKSPNGSRWRITVDNSGNLTTTAL